MAVVQRLELLARTPDLSYRDGIIPVLAWPLVRKQITDVTVRPSGLRAAGDRIAQVLPELRIRGSKGPFQVIGKNNTSLVRGNNEPWDWMLRWASNQQEGTPVDLDLLEAAFTVAVGAVAAHARALSDMPALLPARLTHQRCMALADELFREHSEGAYQQYVIAALLKALIEQERGPERAGSRVETKGINEADAARGQSDIELRQGQRLVEGIEVSANPWEQKLTQARAAIEAGLSRAHVIAAVRPDDYQTFDHLLATENRDISILDLRAVASVILAVLDKPHRELALSELYRYLVLHTTGVDSVNTYVRLLKERQLTLEDQ